MATKSILLSIQPEWVAKILNGEKTIEIRKKFPTGYRGWVYIYCTKNIGKHGENQLLNFFKGDEYFIGRDIDNYNPNDICYLGQNGKVVGRFWCDDVSNIVMGLCPRTRNMPREDQEDELQTIDMDEKTLLAKSCLTAKALYDYFSNIFNKSKNWWRTIFGYAINITNVQVFPEPKDLTDYRKVGYEEALKEMKADMDEFEGRYDTSMYWKNFKEEWEIKKPPQNYFYIEEAIYF